MGRLQVITGGQFGSEAKGAIAGYLSQDRPRLLAIRVAGPNAGHSVYDRQGRKWALRHIPVAAVTNPNATLMLAAGSEVDPHVLEEELEMLDDAGFDVRRRLVIDRQATIISEEHRYIETDGLSHGEGGITRTIGSTGKGVGAARMARLARRPDDCELFGGEVDVAALAARHLAEGGDVLVEGAQGFGLGLHAGYWPFCTSSDCRAIDFLAMAGISPWQEAVTDLEVWVVYRTMPIRVAGNSGPMYGERQWDDLARLSDGYIQPELTTVTHKRRRIGDWDVGLAQQALTANGGPSSQVKVALTFLDYVDPSIAGVDQWADLSTGAREFVAAKEDELGCSIQLLGTSPTSIIDRRGAPKLMGGDQTAFAWSAETLTAGQDRAIVVP